MSARRDGASWAVLWPTLVAALVALAGCSSPPRLSASDFRFEANRICTFGAAQRSALAQRYAHDADTLEAKERALQLRLLDQLRDLKPPESLDDAYQRLLDDVEEIASGGTVAQRAFERFQADASELGLDECAEPSATSASPTPANV